MRNLEKIRKQISRKRQGGVASLHENSRDSRRLHRASVRDDRLVRLAATRSRKEKPLLIRAAFFQEAIRTRGGGPLEDAVILTLVVKSAASLVAPLQRPGFQTGKQLRYRGSHHSTPADQPIGTTVLYFFLCSFVRQFDQELDELKQARRPGRPSTPREDLLRLKVSALDTEHTTGFRACLDPPHHVPGTCGARADTHRVLPDLTDGDNVVRLDEWEGSWPYLTTIHWVHISRDGTTRPAAFPPNGER